MEVIFTLDRINEAAGGFLQALGARRVVALEGEMGAGKTTFVQALCTRLGVVGTVSSPTFSIINQYQGADGSVVYHLDLYRLKDDEEAIHAGAEDALYSGAYCFVEWPGRAPGIFPADAVTLHISTVNSNTRKLDYNL